MDNRESVLMSASTLGDSVYALHELFAPVSHVRAETVLSSHFFNRKLWMQGDLSEFLLDEFPDIPGAASCFIRLPQGETRTIKFIVQGGYRVHACPVGGWLIKPVTAGSPIYWFPLAPILRKHDPYDHITAEQAASMVGLGASADELMVELRIPAHWNLDWVVWRFAFEQSGIPAGLEHPLNLEKQNYFLWGAKANVQLPAGIYLYLIHGHVYTNAFVWPRNWKFHSELDACGLYVALDGLELATQKLLYRLLKRQVLYSVISQQGADGGWRQGEWTDLMESHYRLHNSAMLMLETGLEETGDSVIRYALQRAAAFITKCTDQTAIGTWFLHDSLEESAEAMEEMRRQTKTPWIPSRTLGKSPTNKLILNTHLDAIVTLDRYREVTGDDQYAEMLTSARNAARALLALRPAETLYRLIYWAIHLTLLPKAEAMRLPLLLKAIKRLTWMYLTPQLHRLKRIFPRLVMPGGLIERHVAPLHYDINYHPVNVMDLIRYGRRFPEEAFTEIIEKAVEVVASRNLLEYWSEMENRRFALVVWADALFHLCSLSQSLKYRHYLAETLLIIEHKDLGLPPSLLGSEGEIVSKMAKKPCPSPANPCLRVANMTCNGFVEILVVNPGLKPLELTWESKDLPNLTWLGSEGESITAIPPVVPGRGWLLGREAV